jgi:hypothetical protein
MRSSNAIVLTITLRDSGGARPRQPHVRRGEIFDPTSRGRRHFGCPETRAQQTRKRFPALLRTGRDDRSKRWIGRSNAGRMEDGGSFRRGVRSGWVVDRDWR